MSPASFLPRNPAGTGTGAHSTTATLEQRARSRLRSRPPCGRPPPGRPQQSRRCAYRANNRRRARVGHAVIRAPCVAVARLRPPATPLADLPPHSGRRRTLSPAQSRARRGTVERVSRAPSRQRGSSVRPGAGRRGAARPAKTTEKQTRRAAVLAWSGAAGARPGRGPRRAFANGQRRPARVQFVHFAAERGRCQLALYFATARVRCPPRPASERPRPRAPHPPALGPPPPARRVAAPAPAAGPQIPARAVRLARPNVAGRSVRTSALLACAPLPPPPSQRAALALDRHGCRIQG